MVFWKYFFKSKTQVGDRKPGQYAEMTARLGYIALAVGRENPLADMESTEAARLVGDAAQYADAVKVGRVRFTDIPRLDSGLVRKRITESGIVLTDSRAGNVGRAANDDRADDLPMEQASFGIVVAGILGQLGNHAQEQRTAAQAIRYAARVRRGEVRTGSAVLDRELWVDAGRVPVAIDIWRDEWQSRTVAAPPTQARAMSA